MCADYAGAPRRTPHILGPVHAARTLALLILAAVALVAIAGCRSGAEPRFDAVPGPLRTVDLAVAAADEPTPLSADEWALLEALHDKYLTEYDRLRIEAIAPLVQAVRQDEQRRWMEDQQALSRFAKRHAMVLSRVRAIDDSFVADLGAALAARPQLVARIGDQRAVARSARIVEGLADGRADAPTILDLDPQVHALRIDAATRAAIEPTMANYRRELAQAAQVLATAIVDWPRLRLQALAAAGIDDQRLNELRAHSNEGPDQKAAADAGEAAYAAADREARRPRLRALEAIDAANARAMAQLQALLDPESAERLKVREERRRISETAPVIDYTEFVLDVYRAHPAVQSGRSPAVAEAIARVDRAMAAMREAQVLADRARLQHDALGLPPQESPEAKRLQELQQRLTAASAQLVEAVKLELKGDLTELLEHANSTTPDDMRARLAETIGEAAADRVVRRASRNLFRNPRTAPPNEWDGQKSIAEQLLLAPGMDHGGFRLAARALGARDDDPLVEQMWDRHQARAEEIEVRQRAQFKALEARAEKASGSIDTTPEVFERTLAEFLEALLAADGERRAADEETFREVAIALGVAETDARFVLARAVSSARRAALPWRRFEQPWMLGPLWEADSDPVMLALEIDGDDTARQAALVILTAHAEELTRTADAARRSGLEALRDLLLLGLRAQRSGLGPSDPAGLRDLPAARAIVQRVTEAGRARRTAERAAIEAVAQTLPPERIASFMAAWSRDTFPEFYNDGRAWRDARDAARAGVPGNASDATRGAVAAAIERWKIVDDDMVRRVAEWQDKRTGVPAPAIIADMATAGAADAELGALRTLRDENAWRLLRALASAWGDPPDSRMPGEDGHGSPPRPVRWSQ